MTSPNPKVAPVPKGFRSITASLSVQDVSAAIAYYTNAFAAEVIDTLSAPDSDEMLHAQIKIAGTTLLVTLNKAALPTAGTGHVTLHHYLDDIEGTYESAIDAGALPESPLVATWWGDLNASLIDPFGIRWNLAKRVERLSKDEKDARLKELYLGAVPEQTADATALGDHAETFSAIDAKEPAEN
ncbi:VOC family protein [Shimia aestuarii]|uniref:PhnB protein n=1 Tax=Shimia aestuarii TaxID=254406 RepID=A0A1I4RAY0_9RHOB|nr:VOC family protein [Shimia aestuarii]SFM49432.1 PhnB protein [Shimia aestuarii]